MILHDEKTIARFWAKVDVRGPDECWDWIACHFTNGYGKFRLREPRRFDGAHVVSYQITKGSTGDQMVCHACDRPSCCNPKHLWLGTNSENQKDCLSKGRRIMPPTIGEENPRAILTEDKVLEIRRLLLECHTGVVLAELYGITHSMISRIKLRKAWKHLPG